MRITVALISVFLGACGAEPTAPEEELRQWLSRGEEAAETKQRTELLDMISSAYVDARGNGRDDINTLLRAYFLRQNKISLLTSIEDIRVFGESAAEVELTIAMAGTNSGILGFSADAYRFVLELERNRGDWLLISAQWGKLNGELK